MSSVASATWTTSAGRRVRGVVYPAGAHTVLVTSGDTVGARRLRFPDHAILRMETRTARGEWRTSGFPHPARVQMAVIGLDGPPSSTDVRAYHLALPSHMENGRVCLGEAPDRWDAHERPGDEWARRAYWSTSYRADLMAQYRLADGAVRMDQTLRVSEFVWTRQPGWFGWARRREVHQALIEEPTLDQVAGVLAGDFVTRRWCRRLTVERADD